MPAEASANVTTAKYKDRTGAQLRRTIDARLEKNP